MILHLIYAMVVELHFYKLFPVSNDELFVREILILELYLDKIFPNFHPLDGRLEHAAPV